MENTRMSTSDGSPMYEQFDEGKSIVGKNKDRPGRGEDCLVVYFAVDKVYFAVDKVYKGSFS